jgi:DHA1 family inner membrane transport protein
MQSQPSSYKSVIQIFLLWFAGLTAAAQFAKFSIPFQNLTETYPNAGTNLGLLVSLIGFIGIICGLFASMVVSRFGYRRMLIIALVLGAAISFVQSTLPSFQTMMVFRIIEGISHLIIVVAAPTLIVQLSPQKYVSAYMTLWSSFFGIAFAIVSWGGMPMINTYGIGSLFSAHAISMVIIAVCIYIYLPNENITHSDENSFSIKTIFNVHIQAYSSAFMSAPAIGWLFYTLTYVSMITIVPALFHDQTPAYFIGLLPLVGIATSFACGAFLLTKFQAVDIIIYAFMIACFALLAYWFDIKIEYISLVVFAVLGVVQSCTFASVPQLNADMESQSKANGALAQMGNLGNTIGTPILLFVLSIAGMNGFITAIIAIYLAGAGAHYYLARQRTKREAL